MRYSAAWIHLGSTEAARMYNFLVALVIIGTIVGILVFLLSRIDPESDPDEKKSSYRLRYGETYRAHVVLPPPSYYADGWPEQTTSCQVVFIKRPDVPDRDQRLRTL